MADFLQILGSLENIKKRWRDMGDETHAEVVVARQSDGDDVTLGSTADAAVITDTTGTVSGKLRGLVKWAFERMPASLGQKTKATALPVTLASDEDLLASVGGVADAAVTNPASSGSVIAFLKGAVTRLAGGLPAALTALGNLKASIEEAIPAIPGLAPAAQQVETATVVAAITTTGNATATVTALGMTGSPKAISVAVQSGTAQVETATVIGGPITTAGDAKVTVTAAGMANSPKDVAVPVISGTAQVETATVVGTISTSGNAKATVTADGMTGSPKDVAVAVQAGTAQVETATAVGTVTTSGNAKVTVTADGMSNSPKDVAVAVQAGTAQVETATIVGTVTAPVAQVETATIVGTVTAPVAQIETATIVGTINPAVAQIETATIVGTVTGDGNAIVIVTAAGMEDSPQAVLVPVLIGDDPAAVATKIRAKLALEDPIAAFFSIGGAGADVVLTALTAAANDATMNVSFDNLTCTGLTGDPTSADTVAGSVGGVGNASITVTANGMINSPKLVSVAVAAGDNAATVAGKVRTALGLDADVSAFFSVGGSGAEVALTALAAAADDATMNIASDNGTCTGLTPDPTSDNTQAGVASGSGNASITVTAVGMTGSPKLVSVAVVGGDNASTVAGKVRTALGLDADVSAFFSVGGAGAEVALTALAAAANDVTMNIASDNGTCTGLTPDATSDNTVAGVASGAGNASITVTAVGMTGSPKLVSVAVAGGDDASAVAGKVRTALGLDADVSAFFAISGAGANVVLTALANAANDGTMNIASDNGTCTGLTPDATSDNTVAGVAPDDAAAVGGKIRTALGLDADVAAFFSVGGAGANAALTALANAANDATMNVAITNDTCAGLTPAPTSADTTPGVAPDNASAVAAKVRAALTLDADVSAFFTISGAGADVVLTAIAKAANDATMNLALDNDTCVGLTPDATSTDTVAGVAPDTASAVGGKARTALGLDADVAAFFTVSGAGANVVLTAQTKAANDPTMNIAVDNDTCVGLTAAPTSANTTPGVVPDDSAAVAGKVRTALAADGDVIALYSISGAGASVVLTRSVATDDDPTLNLALADGTCVGVTAAPTSANTTEGSPGGRRWPTHDAAIGALGDAAVTNPASSGSVVALLKGIITRLSGGLPAALAAGGGLKVEGVAGGVAQPVSGAVTVSGTATVTQGAAGAAAWLVSLASVTAAKLAYGVQTRTSITCILAATDYAAGAVIPAGTKYVTVWSDYLSYVAVDQATSATVGTPIPANSPVTFAIAFGHASGDSTVHAQSPTAGAITYITYLQD